MAIEQFGVEMENKIILREELLLGGNNTICAGTIKVKHPLMEETMLLYGFVTEDYYFNEDDFKIKGLKISYRSDDSYECNNNTIYTKLFINTKNEAASKLWNELEGVLTRDHREHGISRSHKDAKLKYHLYETLNDEVPNCGAYGVSCVCKYMVDGKSKYALFNLHELVPVI